MKKKKESQSQSLTISVSFSRLFVVFHLNFFHLQEVSQKKRLRQQKSEYRERNLKAKRERIGQKIENEKEIEQYRKKSIVVIEILKVTKKREKKNG